MEKALRLAELQEIVLWQQLNKQILRILGSDTDTAHSWSQYLNNFCLGKSLFSQLGASSITRDIPLSLFTNLDDLCFISIQDDQWATLLNTMFSTQGAIEYFDIEQARADYFEEIKKYSEKFEILDHTAINGDTGDQGEDLYSFITEYLHKREQCSLNLSQSACELHQLKASTLLAIIQDASLPQLVKHNNREIILDLSKCHNREKLEMKYLECYCERARSHINCLLSDGRLEYLIDEFLGANRKCYNEGSNTRQFIDHEMDILINERNLLNTCLIDTKKRLEHSNGLKIRVCSSSHFYFLKDPLPIA
jgi:hypothetical protein